MAGDLMPCGTRAAYMRHLRYGQPPCEACLDAHNAYERRRYASADAQVNRNIRRLVHILATAMGEGRQP